MTPNDPGQLLRLVAALVFVISLMGGLAFLMKHFNNRRLLSPGGKRKRLQVVEILPLDPRRRLILLRRDNREHLVILGTNGETVIESGIESPQDEAQ